MTQAEWTQMSLAHSKRQVYKLRSLPMPQELKEVFKALNKKNATRKR